MKKIRSLGSSEGGEQQKPESFPHPRLNRSALLNSRPGMGLQTHPVMDQRADSRPTVEDFRDGNLWVKRAKTHWLEKSKVRKVKQDVIKKDFWDPLEAERFNLRSLLILENLNILEKCVLMDDELLLRC